ncbi:MAG: ADP-ribosylglycohydrolase family protein [Bacteroides sp.]|nr:ADP-ribosylglycohydrolase family protein [Bacteroides sp.]
MKHTLLHIALLLFVPVSVGAQIRYGETVELKKDVLLDKIKGGWAGQTIGCTYGGPTEFKYRGATIHDQTPIIWYDDYCKDIFREDPGLYDDVYMDLTFLEVMQKEGIHAPASAYALAFAHADYKLWHANQAARYNILQGIMPPESGHWKNNPHADDIDFQIEADFIGMICPGMVNTASIFSDRIGHIMNYGDGWYGGVYVAAMYALAYVSTDVPLVVTEALKTIPEQSKFHRCIADVVKSWKQYPDDWRKCWLEIENRHAFEVGCPEGVFNAFNIDATINAAYCVIGLLYGNGDFFKTMDIATRCGQDSDCNPATVAGILGVMYGYEAIPGFFKPALERCEDIEFPYTSISLRSVYGINLNLLSDVLQAYGGKVEGDTYYVTIQQPETVPLEISFEGFYPSERREIKYDLGTEKSFDFTGKGVVLMGLIRQEVKDAGDYIARLEAYIDGVKVEDIVMPFDYIKRKYDIFYTYDLEEGPHTLVIRWVNPDPNYAVQCKDLVVYSSEPARPIHPY